MTIFCLHHTDADGLCSAAIVGKFARIEKRTVVYVSMQYGAAVDWELLAEFNKERDEVWVVDFSLNDKEMDRMWRMADGRFVWIDHHYTAINKLAEFADVYGVRQTDRAACLLTWDFCNFGYAAPLAVQLIADRDVWEFKHGDISKHFHEAFWLQDNEPWSSVWDRWLKIKCKLAYDLRAGEILYRSKKKRAINTLTKLGRVEKLHGTEMTVLTCNCMGTGDLGEAARELGHDVLHTYYEHLIDGRLVRTHSLFSSKVDVGEIARIRGGGGHRGAAGWVEKVK